MSNKQTLKRNSSWTWATLSYK